MEVNNTQRAIISRGGVVTAYATAVFCSAWDKRKGMGQEDAKKAYIATVVGQFKAHGYPDEIEDNITQFLPAEAAAGGGEAAPAAAAQ